MLNNKKQYFLKFGFILHNTLFGVIFLFIFLIPYFVTAEVPVSTLFEESGLEVGALIKGGYPEVFIYKADGLLHWIPDESTFLANNFSWKDVIILDDTELIKYSFGDSLTAIAMPKESLFLTSAEIEIKVNEYFADIPLMIAVAKCESGFRQFNEDGTPLIGHNLYVGIYQVAEKIHADYAESLGMDIYTVEGNMAYARHLYNQKGAEPWPACSKTTEAVSQLEYPLTLNLKLDDTNDEVKILQQVLNKIGYNVAKSGIGSLGNETNYFGSLTREAVRRFQCDNDIVCSGSEATTGYGQVGPLTRKILLEVAKTK